MKTKRGISLIVLVITIIIIIILAGAVILNLSNNNPIDNANKAKIMQDMDTFKSDLALSISDKFLEENGNLSMTDVDANTDTELIALIPSIKGTEYVNYLAVENGELVKRDGVEIPGKTEEYIDEALNGKKVEVEETPTESEVTEITKLMIEANPELYIGKSVTYTGYSENTNTIDWRIYGLDKDGNIMLKANDYVDLSYKISEYPEGISQGNGTYNIKATTTDRKTLISYLETSSNWSEYSVEGKTTARGAMTLPEFVEGYNRVVVESEQLNTEELKEGNLTTEDGTFTGNAEGYVIKKGTGSYDYSVSEITESYNDMKFYISNTTSNTYYMWLTSASAHSSNFVIDVSHVGGVNGGRYDNDIGGICPVVSLTSGVLVENDSGEIEVK